MRMKQHRVVSGLDARIRADLRQKLKTAGLRARLMRRGVLQGSSVLEGQGTRREFLRRLLAGAMDTPRSASVGATKGVAKSVAGVAAAGSLFAPGAKSVASRRQFMKQMGGGAAAMTVAASPGLRAAGKVLAPSRKAMSVDGGIGRAVASLSDAAGEATGVDRLQKAFQLARKSRAQTSRVGQAKVVAEGASFLTPKTLWSMASPNAAPAWMWRAG